MRTKQARSKMKNKPQTHTWTLGEKEAAQDQEFAHLEQLWKAEKPSPAYLKGQKALIRPDWCRCAWHKWT